MKKAIKEGNKFIIKDNSPEKNKERMIEQAINRIEEFLGLEKTDFTKASE